MRRLAVGIVVLTGALASAGSALAAGTLDQQIPYTPGSCPSNVPLGTDATAQTFTAGLSGQLDQVDVVLTTVGVPSAALSVEIRNVLPGGAPGSTVLGSASLAPAAVTPSANGKLYSVPLTTPAAVTAGEQYAVVLTTTASSWYACGSNAAVYAGGIAWQINFGVWSYVNAGDTDFGLNTYVSSGTHTPVTLTVDDDKVQCPAAAYTAIQAAVDAAGPGDTINVCRGTYNENVIVGGGKANLSLVSYTAPAAAVVKGGFSVNLAQGVSIQKFRIEPTATGTGIDVAAGSSTALIRSNLLVGGKIGVHVNGDGGTIRDNSLNGQTQQGIAVIAADGGAAKADVLNNTVIGTPNNAGIFLVSVGAGSNLTSTVFGNTASKNGAYGIYLNGSGGGIGTVAIKANSVSAGGTGMSIGMAAAVENNNVSTNTGAGISVGSSGSTLKSNNAKGNGGTDCSDGSTGTGTAGTGNTWIANYGNESNPAGICKK